MFARFSETPETIKKFHQIVQKTFFSNFFLCVTIDAPLLEFMIGHVVVVRVVEQRLRGDAPDIEAGTPECGILLHADSLHPELGRLDDCHIATWT